MRGMGQGARQRKLDGMGVKMSVWHTGGDEVFRHDYGSDHTSCIPCRRLIRLQGILKGIRIKNRSKVRTAGKISALMRSLSKVSACLPFALSGGCTLAGNASACIGASCKF